MAHGPGTGPGGYATSGSLRRARLQGRITNPLDLAGQVSIVPDENTNSDHQHLAGEPGAIKQILEQLDVMPEQVLIEAVVAELRSIDDQAGGGAVLDQPGGRPPGDGRCGPSTRIWTSARRSVPGSREAAERGAIDLASDKRFNVLSTPRICTTNNRQAQINISQSVPYVQDVRETGARAPTASATDVGIILDVTPRITRDGLVTIGSPAGERVAGLHHFPGADGEPAPGRNHDHRVDGETIILGGMIRTRRTGRCQGAGAGICRRSAVFPPDNSTKTG